MEYYLNHLFIGILNMSITAGYCIAAVLVFRLIFCRMPRKYLYALWLVVAFRLICPVSVSTEFSLFNLENFSESTPTEHSASMKYISQHTEGMGQTEFHTGISAADTFVKEQIPQAAHRAYGISLKNLLYAGGRYREPVLAAISIGKYVWLLGMLGFLMYFAVSVQKMKESVRMAVLAGDEGKIRIYECDSLVSPFAMGIFQPGIYVPCYLEGKAREMVLLHERVHIRRRDHLIKPLAFCLLAVYWFHPLVWAAWSCMCRDMEMSCDEKVLEMLGEGRKKEYSMTLLSFASGGFMGSRMPLAFGEHDVKGRIKHTLRFRKPALWLGIPAALLIAAALLVFGTNGVHRAEAGESQEEETLTGAQLLYEAKNPYVGDASANGRLLGAIASVRPDSAFAGLSWKTELQTSEEPYEFHFRLEEDGEQLRVSEAQESGLDTEMRAVSALMLALTDNLGQVHWHYTLDTWDGDSMEMDALCDIQQAAAWCGVNDIKAYGSSPEKVQELLDILEERTAGNSVYSAKDSSAVLSGEITDEEEEFLNWYMELPYELYEQALPWEETEKSYQGYYDREEDFMVILARTEDGVVTVYGCYSREYGSRGVTIDYKITPDGDSNHNYMDIVWDASAPCCQAAMGDYDRDGDGEIALALLSGSGTGVHRERLIVFETYETGTLQPFEFTDEAMRTEISHLVGATVDTENDLLQILDMTKPESSVPMDSFPCEGKEILDVNFLSWFGFGMGEELIMQTEPGVIFKDDPGIFYPRHMDRSPFSLSFRVVYDYSESLGDGYFSLVLLK